ncbi:MAG: ABC transporter ATP-binding protein [Clostridia bacterium]|nr:ABC transporter ATP-binding protein [Clostridia bacterium]
MTKKKSEYGIIKSFGLLWKFMGIRERIEFISLFFFAMISALANVYNALMPSIMIAKFTGGDVWFIKGASLADMNIWVFMLLFCGSMGIFWAYYLFNYRLIDVFARKMMAKTNEKAQEIILLERKNLDFGMTIGEANYILKNAVDNIYAMFEPVCWRFAINIMSMIFMIIQLFVLNTTIGFVALGLIVLILTLVMLRTKIEEPIIRGIEKTNAKIGNHFLMSLTNLPMITIFESKKKELEELKKLNTSFYKSHKKKANIIFWYWTLVSFVEYIGLAVLLATYVTIIGEGVQATNITTIINEMLAVFGYVEVWGYLLGDLQAASIKFGNLRKLYPDDSQALKEKRKFNEAVANSKIYSLKVEDIEVKLGNFKKTYNVEFDAGKIYVISGQSGQGKTTLINAMCGLREMTSGHIVVNNNHKIKNLYDYKYKISYLFQDSVLFDRSIEANIAYPEDELNEEAQQLIKRFDLTKVITRQEEKGSIAATLSGGEKKRIDIARTCSKDKDIYFLDEPTNDLDAKNVSRVLETIKELAEKNKIVIVVSHDERCIQIADEIVNL